MAWGTSFVLVGKHTNKRVFPRQNMSHDLFQYACRLVTLEVLFCPILARATFRKIPALYRNKSSLKRNDSCIGFIVLIPE
jgi:hypothetical protein